MTRETAFLKDMEAWREILACNLAARDPELNERKLNLVIQEIIGHFVFRRICEERGLELFGAGAIASPWHQMGLGYDTLKCMIDKLTASDRPHQFSALPAGILGQIYERFLTKKLHLIADRRIVVEEQTSPRKTRGIYYTPTHIVDYIVAHTVGELTGGTTTDKPVSASTEERSAVARRVPNHRLRLRVVDPACGSGTFLISAYQYLLDWYRTRCPADGAEKHLRELYQAGDSRELTIDERRNILLDHIYGVDIDVQAVTLTKLSLLLKLLEGQPRESLQDLPPGFLQLTMEQLDSNIKAGNSLVAPDFDDSRQLSFFDDPGDRQVRPFDWRAEFPAVFTGPRSGFDVVIGNPPYIFGEYHPRWLKQYFESTYELAKDQYDAYWLFIERGLALTAPGGRFAMIVPDALLARDEAAHVRQTLLDNGLARVYHSGLTFQAGVSTVVFSVAKGTRPARVISEIPLAGTVRPSVEGPVQRKLPPLVEHTCARRRFRSDPKLRLTVHASDEEARLLARLCGRCLPLGSLIAISRGEETGKRHVFDEGPVAVLAGEDVSRYHISPPTRFVWQVTKGAAHYRAPKIVVVKTGHRCVAALDRIGIVTIQSLYNVHVMCPDIEPETILGILNSSLTRFYVEKSFTAYKRLFPQLNQTTLLSIPIPRDITRRQAPLAETVCRMLDLHEPSASSSTGKESEDSQRQIAEIDLAIDRLVYDLYRLKEGEVAVVERSRRAGLR